MSSLDNFRYGGLVVRNKRSVCVQEGSGGGRVGRRQVSPWREEAIKILVQSVAFQIKKWNPRIR